MAILTQSENMTPNDSNKRMENNAEKLVLVDDSFPSVFIQKEDDIVSATKNYQNLITFQAAMKLTVIIGQCFGLNPVMGVCEKDPSSLRFTLLSPRFLYTFLSILGQGLVFGFCVLKFVKDDDISLTSNSSIVFFGTNGFTTILFLQIAMKWPKLCQHIAKLEESDPNLDKTLVRRCNISCILVIFFAFLEHILSTLSSIVVAIDCQPDTNLLQAFFFQSFSWLWTFFHYNPVLGTVAWILNIQCTFNWNFADAFVICVSWYLTARLKQVNDKIVAAKGKNDSDKFWRSMREDWCKVTDLVRRVDCVINGVIFISFANNLFFICLQFLHILEEGVKPNPACDKPLNTRPLKGFEQSVYFLYSFGFLLARSVSVSLIASQVHSASKLPAQSLYDVPASEYSIEVRRFIDQIHDETVALSGLQFFYVKRGLLLTVAGTIVTYELVLMQFAGVSPTTAPPLASLLLSTSTANTGNL